MRRNRIAVGLLWILSLVGISFYGGPVSYGFFILTTLLPLIGLLYLVCVRMRFTIYQRLEGKTFVSRQAIPYFFTLQNESFFAFASVRVFFYSDFSKVVDLADGEEYELLPGSGISEDTSLICRYRGAYHVGIRDVEITDFLRLFRMHYKNPEPLEVMIYPEVATVSELRDVRLTRSLSREALLGDTVPDPVVREYIAGDDRRRIHAAASAREGKWMTRRFAGEEQEGVAVVVGTHRASDKPTEYLPAENRILEIALALSRYFAAEGIPVRAFHRCEELDESVITDNASFETYYRTCAVVPFLPVYEDRILFAELLSRTSLRSSRAVILTLGQWSAEAARFARSLNESGVPVVAFIVSGNPSADGDSRPFVHTEIIPVSPETAITEVL